MISTEKIYTDLLDLYHNSGREFYVEMAAMLGQQVVGVEHSFLIQEERRWKLAASTIKNFDEREFLRREAETLGSTVPESSFTFPQQRMGIERHLVIPLTVRSRGATALWVAEYRTRERVPEKELLKISRLIALFFRLSKEERNWYLDAQTGLPGKVYFMQVLKKLTEGRHKVIVCVFRLEKYRGKIQKEGSGKTEQEFSEIIGQVKKFQLGNLYILSEDTAAIISPAEDREAYARMENLKDQHGPGLLSAIVYPDRDEDIFAGIERSLSGNIRSQAAEGIYRDNPKAGEDDGEEPAEEYSLGELLGFGQEG